MDMQKDTPLFDAEGRMRILDGMRYYKKTENENNVPRFVVNMKENVDRACLQAAAEKAFARFRVQRMTVVRDAARFYLKENLRPPIVHEDDGSRHSLCTGENNGHMLWIGFRGRTITIEFFHGVSDGKGMLPFIHSLLCFYCEARFGDADCAALNPAWKPEDIREYTEAVRFLPDEAGAAPAGYSWGEAFQLEGRHLESETECSSYELIVDAGAFEAYMRANASSRSAVFAMFMNHAVASRHDVGEAPVVAALAVDARGAYGAEGTMQCCVATAPLWLDREILALPMSERLRHGREMILEGTQAERICASALRTRAFNVRLEEEHPTLAEKQACCRRMNDAGSTKYSYGISYVGEIRFGEAVDRHIENVRVLLCANTIPVILEIIKFAGKYCISYCSHFAEDPYVEAFRQMFTDADIPCTLRKMENFVESRAVF